MESKPLTFGELKEGDFFVDFPTDGDDSGHGGFRGGAYVFKKIDRKYFDSPDSSEPGGLSYNNAFRLIDGSNSRFPDTMQVYKVIL